MSVIWYNVWFILLSNLHIYLVKIIMKKNRINEKIE